MVLADNLRITHSVRDEVRGVDGKVEDVGDRVEVIGDQVDEIRCS